MKRVMITGGPGSGKSTLARLLGDRTGLPIYYMDHIHHMAGWQPRPMAEKIVMCQEITDRDTWIFEGGLSATYPERLRRADTLIWLDFPVGLRIWRVIRRLIRGYGKSREDLPDDCPEQLDRETFAFWKWIWDTRHTARAKVAAMAADPSDTQVVHLRSLAQVNAWLATLPPAPYLTRDAKGEPHARPIGD